jgi:DNA-binding response OmpR family regulator
MIEEIYAKIQADESRPEPIDKVLQGVAVLFADKDERTLGLFKKTADYLGWHGDYVQSVDSIIELINHNCAEGRPCYDAIVSGVNFFTEDGPRLTGITAARQIRKVKPEIPIVFVTSYVTNMIREEVRRVNAELIPKPVDVVELFARVSQLVYWHRLTNSDKYGGEDRRKTSVYFGQERRRGTDKMVAIPRVLSQNIEDALRENYETKRPDESLPSIGNDG